MSVSSHVRPVRVALPLSSLQLRLLSLHVRPVDVRPVALPLVSSATQKILAVQAGCCPRVAVALHVWPVSSVWLFFNESKRHGECTSSTCWSLHACPLASFNCLLSNSKKNLQCMKVAVTAYRTQGMGSLSVCFSTEIFNSGCKCHRMYDAWVFRLSSLQLKRILSVQAGDYHCMYQPWPLFFCSSTESKLSSTVKANAKLAVSVVRLSFRVHEKKIAEMSKWWPFFPWFLRSSSSSFSKSTIILSLLHMAPFPSATAAAPVSQCDRRMHMLDKISLQATETEESIWPGSKVCEYQRRHSHRP